MALIVCMDCGKEVPERVRKCPHCGALIACATAHWTSSSTGSSRRGGLLRAARFVLIVVALGAGYWAWQATTSDKKAPFSAGFSAAFREPRRIADERVALKAGRHVSYAFGLETDSRVHVRVTAVTDPVDMMLLPRTDAEKFRDAGGDLFGGGYSGFPALCSRQVGMLDKTEVVPKGEWALVVVRPEERGSGRTESPAEIAVTVY